MIRLAALAVLAIAVGCSQSPPAHSRSEALDAFARDLEPEALALVQSTLFDPPVKAEWTAPARFASEEPDVPLEDVFARGERVTRSGKLSSGADFWVEGFYSYQSGKTESASVMVELPIRQAEAGQPEPITRALLKSLSVHPALTDQLIASLGPNSAANRSSQAKASIAGKSFEATTSAPPGGSTLLQLACTYRRSDR